MNRKIATFPVPEEGLARFKQRMTSWASSRFVIFLFLDSNEYAPREGRYECLLGAGNRKAFCCDGLDVLREASRFVRDEGDWLIGHLSYDARCAFEPGVKSGHEARFHDQPVFLFQPEHVVGVRSGSSEVFVQSGSEEAPEEIFAAICAAEIPVAHLPSVAFTSRHTKEAYLEKIAAIREHIRAGDCYELNFCDEGWSEGVRLDPLAVFHALNAVSPAPFAAFYKKGHYSAMCASPERYLCRRDSQIFSQPIKGTAPRGSTPQEDEALRAALAGSRKDRAENVMITDLVRSDLARVCEPGSIAVEELFGIHTYPQVHQMVSTVSGRLKQGLDFTDALAASFPMGSMTGAPKVKVMELIETLEASRRELYSGTLGYVEPGGDFDFNVVIRSLFYADRGLLSYHTGGAITWDSDPEAEWEEARLKAWALERIFRA